MKLVRILPDDASTPKIDVDGDDDLMVEVKLVSKANLEALHRCKFEPSPGWFWVGRDH